jgi:hypothetical protein
MQTAKWAARIGAGFYVLWGIFHLVAANSVYVLAEQLTGMVRGWLLQNAFYLLFFAISGILMAVILNWRNDKQGYWMNGTLLAFADIPFILFVLVPGLIPWWPGLQGRCSGWRHSYLRPWAASLRISRSASRCRHPSAPEPTS